MTGLVRILSALIHRKLWIFTIVIIASLVVSAYAYAFTSLGRAPGTCAPLLWGSGNRGATSPPFSIVSTGEQYRPELGTGTISWCIYSNSGALERSYQTNRILGRTASSADGQYLVAAGYKILAGPAGIYGDGAVYLFDKSGQIRWNVSSNSEIFSVHINSNGSVIVANAPDLLYLNNQGSVIWNYTGDNAFDAAIVNDGASVVAGLTSIHFPNHLNGGSEVVMFDNRGNTVWNYPVPDEIFGSISDLAVLGGHIAAGVEATGHNGTLLYFDLQGSLIWSKHVDTAILSVNFVDGGSAILVEGNWGLIRFDLNGNVIGNQEIPH
jgi:PQQ-like domain